MSTRSRILTYLLVLLISLTIAQNVQAPSATVSKQVMCKGIDKSQSNWQPIGIADTFSTADEAVYTFINLDNVNPPVNIKVVWVAPHEIEGEGNNYTSLANAAPTKIEWKGSGSMYDSLSIAGSNYALPVGVWEVQVYADTTLLSTAQFKLNPSVDLTMSNTPKKGETIYPGDTATATFEVQNTGKTVLKRVNFAIASPIPGDVSALEATAPKDIAPGATEKFDVKMKFAKEGNYTVTFRMTINEEVLPTDISLDAQVSPASSPLTLAIFAIAAIVVVILVAVLLMRRRSPSRPAIAPMPYAPPPPTPAVPQATKYCISCGAQIPAQAKHCSKCGAPQR